MKKRMFAALLAVSMMIGMTGSENNDEFYVNDKGHVVTKTNNHGGRKVM